MLLPQAGGSPLIFKSARGGLPFAMLFFAKGGPFDLAFYFLVSHPQKPFNHPNSRSTLIFDRSLQNT
jgi:hypothetical protein